MRIVLVQCLVSIQSMLLDIYGLSTVSPLQYLYICISKVLKQTVIPYLLFDKDLTSLEQRTNREKPMLQVRKADIRGGDLNHTAFEKEGDDSAIICFFYS